MTETIFNYRTIKAESEGRYTSRSSKFFGYVFPVTNEEDVTAAVNKVKSIHHKARHICYAYRLVAEGSSREFATDAGEPSGSAGIPVLGALRSEQLYNTCAVVARFFGGTKLGIPGLIEAYRTSVENAIANGAIIETDRKRRLKLSLPVSLQPHFYQSLKRMNLDPGDTAYGSDRFIIEFHVPLQNADSSFIDLLRDLSQREYAHLQDYLDYLDVSIIETDDE